MEQVVVEGWMGRKDCCHLVVVRRMYVFINTVACELHLPGGGRNRHVIGLSRVGAKGENTDQVCYRLTCHAGTGLWSLPAAHTLAQCKGGSELFFAEL